MSEDDIIQRLKGEKTRKALQKAEEIRLKEKKALKKTNTKHLKRESMLYITRITKTTPQTNKTTKTGFRRVEIKEERKSLLPKRVKLTIRMTTQQYNTLKKQAEELNIDVAKLTRLKLFGSRPYPKHRKAKLYTPQQITNLIKETRDQALQEYMKTLLQQQKRPETIGELGRIVARDTLQQTTEFAEMIQNIKQQLRTQLNTKHKKKQRSTND